MISIEAATPKYISEITEIYNEAVRNTTATFDTEEKSESERLSWLNNRGENFPVIVAIKENKVVGYGAINPWSTKKGYDNCGEVSFYIQHEFRGKGIGLVLLENLVITASQTKLQTIISRITSDNTASIVLHEKLHFEKVGLIKNCGYKFNKVHSVWMYQKVF
jgi:phosphinothricin acetyltransferase